MPHVSSTMYFITCLFYFNANMFQERGLILLVKNLVCSLCSSPFFPCFLQSRRCCQKDWHVWIWNRKKSFSFDRLKVSKWHSFWQTKKKCSEFHSGFYLPHRQLYLWSGLVKKIMHFLTSGLQTQEGWKGYRSKTQIFKMQSILLHAEMTIEGKDLCSGFSFYLSCCVYLAKGEKNMTVAKSLPTHPPYWADIQSTALCSSASFLQSLEPGFEVLVTLLLHYFFFLNHFYLLHFRMAGSKTPSF